MDQLRSETPYAREWRGENGRAVCEMRNPDENPASPPFARPPQPSRVPDMEITRDCVIAQMRNCEVSQSCICLGAEFQNYTIAQLRNCAVV
jgi:hypothetical protein